MKKIKMKSFTFYWDGENKTESAKIVAVNFATAIKAAFGDNIPNITSVYSDEVTVYTDEESNEQSNEE